MKPEVGMYIRYKPLLSRKYVKINKIKEIEEKESCLHIWLEDEDLITEKYLIKASHNIIDLIEVGDYVNGHRVEEINFENEEIFTDSEYYCGVVEFNDVKSVITHEQMEQMAYKVGE